jgi:hypothetical protein
MKLSSEFLVATKRAIESLTIRKNMKRVLAVLLLVGTLGATTSFATTISTVAGYGPYQTGSGGEFTFKTSDPIMNAIVANYYSGARNQDLTVADQPNFQTFCVEGKEFVNANTSYDVLFNDHSVYSGNYLTKGAALLYSQFASGTLPAIPGYNYVGSRSTSADLLQRAIWAFMGGQEGEVLTLSNPYENYAASVFGSLALANATATSGFDGVYVLNMFNVGHLGDPNYKAQDMLIWAPSGDIPNVPDGGLTVILLGMGFAGLGFISRRVRA